MAWEEPPVPALTERRRTETAKCGTDPTGCRGNADRGTNVGKAAAKLNKNSVLSPRKGFSCPCDP